ncbi:hypothetical protein EDF67_10945 [Sphingobacterium sp. JUb78]|nr:hypothetical protein [Sphingobacterium kitahiroshimense]TCR05909.1 hypothetical protein EDF67_10945 [Sphingobacterium sp. JUb78]
MPPEKINLFGGIAIPVEHRNTVKIVRKEITKELVKVIKI